MPSHVSIDVGALIELATDAVIVRRRNGEILFWNAGAERLYGWSADQAIGRKAHDLFAPTLSAPRPDIAEAMIRSGAWEGVLHHLTATGRDIVVASRWTTRQDADDTILEINRDETARHQIDLLQQAEHRQFELLTSRVPVMVAHFDSDLRFNYANAAYAARFGLTPATIVGRRLPEVIGPDAFGVIARQIAESLAGARVEDEAWITYTHAGRRYMRYMYTPDVDSSGTVVGIVASVIDETARKTAEEALSQSRARFDFVSNSAEIGVWSCDLPFAELVWNPTCKMHFGLPADATVTIDTFYEQMHPADVAPTRAAIDRALEGGATYNVEYRTRQQDGSYRWVRAIGRAEYDDAGVARRFVGITLDITSIRRADERFRELADVMPQIVWTADAEGRVDYLNRRWYELTGTAPHDPAFMTFVHPDDRQATLDAFLACVQSGNAFEREYRLCLPGDAEPRWFLGRAVPSRDESGRIVRWYATSTDIHEQKRAEATLVDNRDRLRAALDASLTGTFRWDLDSNALEWDGNLDRLFGLEPGTTAQSLPEFVGFVHPDDRQRVMDACVRCATSGVDFVEEFRVVWPDGTERWLFDQGRVLADGRGSRYMVGACVDVTDRRTKEEALRAADRQKDEFLGMLAHELRNPLAPMIYSAALLERRVVEPGLRRPVEIIRRQAERMIRIVDDLLDVSRVTQGKIALQRERVPVASLLGQAVESTRPLFEARRHTVRLHPVAGNVVVLGDQVRLAQVLENLLVNAAKYTADGGMIDIEGSVQGGSVSVAVRDTGVGIAPDMLARVFDLFAQADVSLDRSEGGLGIGLTLAQRLARLHGGEVVAHSAGLGQGSTFTLTLPRIDEAPTVASAQADLGSALRRRVLIIDDNRDGAEMLETLLALSGHEVRVAHDGADGVRCASAFEPDIVLLDIGLPGRSGFDIIVDLRGIPALRGARIVATTGYGREEDRARCLAAGFDAHLTKPVDLEQLRSLLASTPARR